MTTGRVLPELALRLGLTGLAGRASGQARDLRCDQPWPPYDRLQPRRAGSDTGDVAARVAVRFDEVFESLRLIREYLEGDGTIGDVLGLDAGGGHVISAMWHGIWSGQIDCDLDRPLKRKTRIVVHEPEAVTA